MKNTCNVNDEQLSGYKGPDESTSKRKMLTKEKGKGTNSLHKPLNQTTTQSRPCNNDSTEENLTIKERKRANNALVETTGPGFKISGNTIHEIPDKNMNDVQTGNTTEVPYKFVNSGTHCDIKKGAQTSKQCTGREILPRIQIPGKTMQKTPNKNQELRTDGQHKCQNHRKN
jgi:hypothetical protein